MTAQSNNTVLLDGRDFEITARTNAEPFVPEQYGLSPVAPHTGCWAGFRCRYAIVTGRLLLTTLWITHGRLQGFLVGEYWELPALNGAKPNLRYEPEGADQEFQGKYEDVGLSISYDGDLLVSALSHSDEPRFRGYPRPWHFDTVLQLKLSDGALTDVRDVSEIMKTFNSRYCFEGVFYERRNGLRYLNRHLGQRFDV